VIWNETGAEWNVECSGQTLSDSYGNGAEIFNNAGLLCKTNVSGNTAFSAYLNIITGTVDAEIGSIDFSGGYTLGAAGTLSFGLNSQASFGQISFASTAPLNGTLSAHLNDGYVPTANSSFTILSYGAFIGDFSTTNLPSEVTWQTTYGSTALTIKSLTAGPDVPSLTILSRPSDAIVSWPTNFSGYVLNQTISLKRPITWSPITSGITVNGTNYTTTINDRSGSQFFVLIAP
jgi:hypothetical protein